MPQQDLLGHHKTKLFITHGGIQGAFESICHGVKSLGVPLAGDQEGNIDVLIRKGMALSIKDYRVITYNEVRHHAQDMTNPAIQPYSGEGGKMQKTQKIYRPKACPFLTSNFYLLYVIPEDFGSIRPLDQKL